MIRRPQLQPAQQNLERHIDSHAVFREVFRRAVRGGFPVAQCQRRRRIPARQSPADSRPSARQIHSRHTLQYRSHNGERRIRRLSRRVRSVTRDHFIMIRRPQRQPRQIKRERHIRPRRREHHIGRRAVSRRRPVVHRHRHIHAAARHGARDFCRRAREHRGCQSANRRRRGIKKRW